MTQTTDELDRKIGAYIMARSKTNVLFAAFLDLFIEVKGVPEEQFRQACRAKMPKIADVVNGTTPPGGEDMEARLRRAPTMSDAELMHLARQMVEGIAIAAEISMKLRGLL